MESLFSRLFKYRSSQENFLTEIFAFLLQNNCDVLREFLGYFNTIAKDELENLKVETQHRFITTSGSIKPDIVISDEKRLLFIENKVRAGEGKDQLETYLDYLGKEAKEGVACALLYITWFYDPKVYSIPLGVSFNQIRWWQVYNTLAEFEKNDPFVFQTRLFMKESGLSMSRNFSPAQIMTMMQWNSVREMMDISLGDDVQKRFEEITRTKYSRSSVDKNLRLYGDYCQTAGHLYWVEIGYFFLHSDNENYPYIGGAIVVEPGYSNRLRVVQAFEKFVRKNTAWMPSGDFNDEGETIWITRGWSLNELIGSDDHIIAIQKNFLEILSDVEDFQKDNLDLFWD